MLIAYRTSGGIIWIFVKPPRYATATRINLAFSIGIIFVCFVNFAYPRAQNLKKALLLQSAATPISIDAKTENFESADALEYGEEQRKRQGDRHPSFRYTL